MSQELRFGGLPRVRAGRTFDIVRHDNVRVNYHGRLASNLDLFVAVLDELKGLWIKVALEVRAMFFHLAISQA